jgi:PAS domain S-box-containing protein
MNKFLLHNIHSVTNASARMGKPEETSSQTMSFSPELAANNGNEIQDRLGILAFAFDQSDEIVIVCDESFNIVFVNKKACKSLEFSQDELLGTSISDIAPNIDEEMLVQSSLVDYSSDGSMNIDMYYKTKTKETFSVKVKISPFMSRDRYFTLEAKDISASTPFYKLISNREKQDFFALVETFPDIILRYDLRFWCTYVNEACEKIIGYPRYLISENFLGLSWFLPDEQIRWVKHNLRLVIESGLPIEFELVLAHASSGLPVYLQVIVLPEFDAEHKITGVMVVGHDISEQKCMENKLIVVKDKAEEGSIIKSFFLDSFRHQMRSPLNTIIGLSRLLRDETLSQGERNEFLDLIEESGMNIERMGEGIFNLLKIESGNLELNLENYNAYTIIKEQYIEINEMLRLKQKDQIGVRLDLQDSKIGGMSLSGDVKLIKQILHILTCNAVRFTFKGEITIGARFSKRKQVIFYVSDTGIGIPEDKQESLSDPSAYVDILKTKANEGSAHGLLFARRMTQALGGELTLISKAGVGSTFSFSLPTEYDTLNPIATGPSVLLTDGYQFSDTNQNR